MSSPTLCAIQEYSTLHTHPLHVVPIGVCSAVALPWYPQFAKLCFSVMRRQLCYMQPAEVCRDQT
jgi:hypothetical protein